MAAVQAEKPVYVWLPLAPREAQPLRRAVGALLRELDDAPPSTEIQDLPEHQVRHALAALAGLLGICASVLEPS